MIKIKVKDKEEYILSSTKYKDTSVLELIEVLNKTLSLLKEEHEMSEERALETLKAYRDNLEEVD